MQICVTFIPGTAENFTHGQKSVLSRRIRQAAREAASVLGFDGKVTFIVFPLTRSINGMPWIDAQVLTREWVKLFVPPQFDLWSLLATVFHEMFHVVAGDCLYGDTIEVPDENIPLIELVLREGVAIAFEAQRVPNYQAPYRTFDEVTVAKWLPRLLEDAWSTDYYMDTWFYGKGKDSWVGFKLGYYLVGCVLEQHPHMRIEDLVGMAPAELLRLSGIESIAA